MQNAAREGRDGENERQGRQAGRSLARRRRRREEGKQEHNASGQGAGFGIEMRIEVRIEMSKRSCQRLGMSNLLSALDGSQLNTRVRLYYFLNNTSILSPNNYNKNSFYFNVIQIILIILLKSQ